MVVAGASGAAGLMLQADLKENGSERSTLSGAPRRIETPPFFAIPICAGITNTMGGIAVD